MYQDNEISSVNRTCQEKYFKNYAEHEAVKLVPDHLLFSRKALY